LKAELISLGELTEATRPICYGVLKPGAYCASGVPLVRVTDISANAFDESNLMRISSQLDEEFRRSRLKGGEILLSIQGTVGRVAICPDEFAGANISRTIAVIQPDSRVDTHYLYWYLRSLADASAFEIVGSTRDSLNIGALRKIRVPVVPLDEQRRRAAILDRANELLAKRQETIATLQRLTDSLFIEMFGDPFTNPMRWAVNRLDATCDLVNGRAFKPEEWEETGLPIIRIQNLNDPRKPFNYTTKSIPEKFGVRAGDTLFSWSGTPGTSFGCFCWGGPEGWLNQHIFNVRLNGLLRSEFFIAQVNLKIGELIGKAHGGVGLQHVTKGMVDETELMIPPLEIQDIFAVRKAHIDELRLKYLKSLAQLKALVSSIQRTVFPGSP
jgi:type I restriction enzyme S subunit